MEQSAGRRPGNNAGCKELGIGYGKDDREQYRMQGTWNRVLEGCQGTVQNAGNMEHGPWNMVQGRVQHAGNMEQSMESRSGNSTGCREHGTEYIKVARE